MGPGGFCGLQNRCPGASASGGGFDSLALPPLESDSGPKATRGQDSPQDVHARRWCRSRAYSLSLRRRAAKLGWGEDGGAPVPENIRSRATCSARTAAVVTTTRTSSSTSAPPAESRTCRSNIRLSDRMWEWRLPTALRMHRSARGVPTLQDRSACRAR
jgi:hypothetical protein